ncbi:MAG: diaminopimelate epimerase [Lactobacillus sp.]|jgi:diaminopimelate epimerase|nr:diaminopimelate epimerase [Lactobacillus sp.]MCI2033930.1 diaminopimelate epimerase [Lactobacillus sp.]
MAELLKVHGSDNNFFLLDQTALTTPLPATTLTTLAQRLSAREHGLLGGADGLLVVDADAEAAGRMTVINADGSIAKMCGNGLRTVSRYLSEKTGADTFTVQTAEARLRVHQAPDLAAGVPAYGVEISPVSFAAKDLPFTQLGHEQLIDTVLPQLHPTLRFTAVAVPNPHLIAFVAESELNGDTLRQLGERLNAANPYFPEGVNVTFAAIEGQNTLFARTYERGVGFTNACGTGMSATSLALVLTHPEVAQFETPLTVYNPGGMVQTIVHQEAQGRYWIELIGNATVTDTITVPEASLTAGTFAGATSTPTGEATQYAAFVANLPHRDVVAAV